MKSTGSSFGKLILRQAQDEIDKLRIKSTGSSFGKLILRQAQDDFGGFRAGSVGMPGYGVYPELGQHRITFMSVQRSRIDPQNAGIHRLDGGIMSTLSPSKGAGWMVLRGSSFDRLRMKSTGSG